MKSKWKTFLHISLVKRVNLQFGGGENLKYLLEKVEFSWMPKLRHKKHLLMDLWSILYESLNSFMIIDFLNQTYNNLSNES